jgi:hypothetical protein
MPEKNDVALFITEWQTVHLSTRAFRNDHLLRRTEFLVVCQFEAHD